jgi:MOSC domain-containing protein YiiM
MSCQSVSLTEITAGMAEVLASPREVGTLETIVVRPASDRREFRQAARVTPDGGVEGDKWATSCWLKLPDGRPDPRVQVSVMNARIVRLIAGTTARVDLAGDNLIVDFDLSEANLAVGDRLAIGEVILQVSDMPHTGCGKFRARYGTEAVEYINAPRGRSLRLRGLFASVVQGGTVRVGDAVRKVA